MTVDAPHPDRSPVTRCAALVAGQLLALAALVAAGTRPPFAGVPWLRGFGRWCGAAAPVDAVAVVTYRVALLVAAWLLVSTCLHLAAAITRVPALVRATAWAALPATRRAAAALVLTAGVASGVASPTVASAASAASAHRPDTDPVRDGRAPTTLVTATAPAAPVVVAPAASPVAAPVAAPITVVVQPGDSLWSIAERVVAAEQGAGAGEPGLSDDVVAPRWASIVERNAGRLPSGDPSLIHPGETVVVQD